LYALQNQHQPFQPKYTVTATKLFATFLRNYCNKDRLLRLVSIW